jgi:serine/threonine protein kinase
MADSTLKEFPEESITLSDQEAKVACSPSLGFSLGEGSPFRGWSIQEQLPTKGAEADLYLVQMGKERCVLKLYRHRLEPKLEVLERIAEISRTYSRCFVFFRDVGFDERTGRWYELLEYIPLGSLRDMPPGTKQKTTFIAGLVPNLAEAIHCLHLNEIVHCDVKPSNVLVRSLDPLNLVLTDFGISSLLASDMSKKMTRLKGTPMYWAPEAFSRTIGRSCDWWGLGMIVLELLAGKHPFEGLTDSQIIHKLTIGNVEIPDFLDLRWALLLKGLLTKDDGKRWRYGEVARWLAGEYNIPQYYEERQVSPSVGKNKPFRFGGEDYFTMEDLARVFAAAETPWLTALDYLRYVRQWLESNMMFDEATAFGEKTAGRSPEEGLFRFVHENASCSFCLMGKRIDVDNLYLFLERTVRHEASRAEIRIVEMLGNGQLLLFHDEYLELSGQKRDPFLYNLLRLLDQKTLFQQWSCCEAIRKPEAWLLPVDARTPEKILETLPQMKTLPLKRDTLEELEKNHVLPEELRSLFHSTSTYAEGVAKLEFLKREGLLLPKDPYSFMFENLSLDEYQRAARVRCLGHTSAILEKIAFLVGELSLFSKSRNDLQSQTISAVLDRLKRLKEQKITPEDVRFIQKAADLFVKRKTIGRFQWARYALALGGGVSGGWFLNLTRTLAKAPGRIFFWYCIVVGGGGLLWNVLDKIFHLRTIFDVGKENGKPNPFNRGGMLAPLVVLSGYMSSGALPLLLPEYFLRLLSWVLGAVPGIVIPYVGGGFFLTQKTRMILKACEEYHVAEMPK